MKLSINQLNTTIVSAIMYFILMNSGNFFSWAYQIILTNYLTKEEVSLYFSLIALISILISPFSTFNLYLQEKINYLRKNNDELIYDIIKKTLFFLFYSSISILLVLLISKKIIFEKFDHYNTYTYINFSMVFLVSMFLVVPTSIINAYKKYAIPGIVYVVTDIVKLILGLLLFKFSSFNEFNIAINLNLFFVSFLLIGNTLYFKLKYKKKIIYSEKKFDFYESNNVKTLLKFISFSICMPLIMNLDILAVKFIFSAEDSAHYILGSTLSKISFFLSSTLFAIIYNENIIKKFDIERDYSKFLTFIAIIVSLAFTIILIIFSKQILIFLYGESYIESAKIIYYLGPSLLLASILNIVCNYLVTRDNFSFIIVFVFYGIFFSLAAIYLTNDIIKIAKFQLFFIFGILTLTLIILFKEKFVKK